MKDDSELSKQLENYVDEMKQKNDAANKSSITSEDSKIAKTRKSAKENFAYSLLLGVAEAKLKGESIKGLDLSNGIDWLSAYVFCLKLSTDIESGMWVFFQHENIRGYERKFRQLSAALRNDDKISLRAKLLKGEIEPIEMTSMTMDDLAAPNESQEQEQVAEEETPGVKEEVQP